MQSLPGRNATGRQETPAALYRDPGDLDADSQLSLRTVSPRPASASWPGPGVPPNTWTLTDSSIGEIPTPDAARAPMPVNTARSGAHCRTSWVFRETASPIHHERQRRDGTEQELAPPRPRTPWRSTATERRDRHQVRSTMTVQDGPRGSLRVQEVPLPQHEGRTGPSAQTHGALELRQSTPTIAATTERRSQIPVGAHAPSQHATINAAQSPAAAVRPNAQTLPHNGPHPQCAVSLAATEHPSHDPREPHTAFTASRPAECVIRAATIVLGPNGHHSVPQGQRQTQAETEMRVYERRRSRRIPQQKSTTQEPIR